MIDLSFLTEEEQEAIMKVLQRDAELKRAEEERVRHLPEKIKDDVQLKNMSGQWFYEAKSKRHRDKIHGADIIRASMRRKPATLAEVSQNKSNKVKNSWVSNVNKEVFVPPELHGIVEHQEEQPQLKSSSSSKPITSMLDKPEERFMKAAVSPVKQRRNPFNSTASGDNLANGESENGPAILPQLSNKGLTEILSLSEDSQPKPNLENDEMERSKKPSVELTDESQKGHVKHPVPKARKLIHKATDAVSQREGFVPKPAKRTERVNGIGTPPRGILKRTSSSSSTDSEVRVSQMLDVQKKNALPTVIIFEGEAEKNSPKEEVEDSTRKVEDSTQISLEKLKQVRFSSSTGKGEPLQSPQLHHGREKGEFDLLESDEIKSSGNDGIRSDSFSSKQISAVKPSSALQVKTIDGLQDDTLASGACDTNKSVFLVNETLQSKPITPKKLETPQKTSSNIEPDSNKELGVNEMCENKANQFLSCESKLRKNFTDEHQLSAKTEAHEVSNTNSTSLQQGKPDLVEKRDAKTTFKPDKHADELMKLADESLSKVLDWFERSSGTEDTKHVSARSQGREPKEEVDFSAGTVTLPTEHSGPSMDGKTQVAVELPFRKIKQQNTISPPFILANIQLIKEGMKPKKEEENEKQNDKSLTEFDCTRDEEKEHGQEIKEQNKKSNLLEHEEQKPLAQKCESEKAIQEKRRIREIRAFWERNKTIPSHEEKEININTNVAGGGALKGLRESDKIQPTAEYLSNRLDDQSKNMLRSGELSCASQASINEHQNSREFAPGHVVEQPQRTLASDEVHEFTELPKIVNLQSSVGATSLSPESEDKDEKESLKGKVSACSQQKPSFQVFSLKEKIKEKSKNQISGPSQFQSLRNFWDTRVKLQSSVDRGDASLPINTSLITCERKLEEDEGSVNVSKQELIQQQTQIMEQEKNQKLDSVVHELPVGSSTLNGLNMTHMKNTDSVQLDRKLVISKPWEKMGLPKQEIEERIEKSTISPKEIPVSLHLFQSSGVKDALKETMVDDLLCSPIEKVENKTALLDINLPKEEVAETVDKVILPKAEVDVFKLGLKKLEKEASEMSTNLKLKENILKETTFHSNQCEVSERKAEHSHDISHAYQKEEISKSTGKPNVLLKDEHENVKSFRKLLREFEPFSLQHQAADKDDTRGHSQRHQGDLQNLLRKTFAFQPSEFRKMEIKSLDDTNSISQTNRSVESAFQEDTDQPEEVNETIEKSVAPSKFNRLTSALEKLLREASETQPPKPKHAEGTVLRTAEMEVKSIAYRCDHNGELPQEIRETVEKSFAPSKVSGLTSALEKLLKETSELPPAKPKHADNTVQKTVEMEVINRTSEHDGELPQEIRETIEKSVAPSKVSDLTSALEKLLEDASEMLPAKPKHSDGTVQRTAETEGKSMTYVHNGELPQEIGETIEKSVAPSKVSDLTSALEKLRKDASEMLPAKPKHSDGMVQRSAEMEGKSMTYEHDGELSQEIKETIEKSVALSKGSSLTSALEKLLKEASETPLAKPKRSNGAVWRTVDMQVRSTTYEHNGELPQEIRETIEHSVAPSKVSSLTSASEELRKEASETPPAKPKHADNAVQKTVEMEVKNKTSQHDVELPQEIRETIEKSVAPSKVSSLTSTLEKMLEEASEMLPAKPKGADNTVEKTVKMEFKSTTCDHDRELPEKIGETVVRSALSKYDCREFDIKKLLDEASETPASLLKNMDKKTPGKVEAGQSVHSPHQQGRDHSQETEETIEKTYVSNTAKFSEFSISSEKLLKEPSETSSPISKELHKQEKFGDRMFPSQKATLFVTMSQPYSVLSSYHTQMKTAIKGGPPEQNTKTSINELAISEIEASDLPERNRVINKIEERNVAPADLSPLEGETNMTAVKPLEINEEGRRGESTFLDDSVNHSEFKALLKFRRASTPLKDESNSFQSEGAQLCLMSLPEDNDEEEGEGSNSGFNFLDENFDSHSGTSSSIRSEEELNPVLMALKRSADRKMPSKSLEDIPSATSNKGKIKNTKEELALSAEDVSTVPSQPDKLFSHPEKLKGLSKSVPSFLQEESDDRETDTASESSYSLRRIKKSPSSLTNLSGSSGMASLSSVSSSLMSIYSADFGNVDVKGNIQFAIDYVEQLKELHILICQCKDLAVADVKRQRSDPYVKTYLLPEKYKLGKRKTSVKKKTFNPIYNEILRYKTEKGLLKNQNLNISVWHNDTFGRNSFLGEVELDLGTWDWNDKSNKQINWYPLKPRTSTMAFEPENRGEMKIALQYVPHPVGGKKTLYTGEVHIWVKECHDLPILRGNRLNSFIKCTVLPDTSRKSRQKTRTVAKTTNPVFNHTMVYDGFRPEDLKEACIELTVWDHHKLANHFLGGLRIGLGTGKSYGTTVDWMDSTSDESALWEKMMNSPNTWIEDTLPLRMLMVAKLTK